VGVGNGTALPFPDRSFDLVLNRHTAYNANEVARALAARRRIPDAAG